MRDLPPTAPIIQILDETTANQIAAGEVVERPASVVKELVENALDAGARRICVELEEGGKYLIRVTDDGIGMTQADCILALQRHATSKITRAEDLFQIMTMGFRGEALPSIASVSQMTLVSGVDSPTTDTEALTASEIRCLGGAIGEVGPIAAPRGTSITVENLFFNVPARLKFLKTSNTELGHSLELVQRMALAHPEVALRLSHNGQELFVSDGNDSLLDSCVRVFGRDTARHLVPICRETPGLCVAGFVGTPAALKGSRSAQHVFVNRRFIRSKSITRALDEAYRSVQQLHGAKFPAAVILVQIDPTQLDINVSPTKTEVRFAHEGNVYSAVYHAVQDALMAGGLVATVKAPLTAQSESWTTPRVSDGVYRLSGAVGGAVREAATTNGFGNGSAYGQSSPFARDGENAFGARRLDIEAPFPPTSPSSDRFHSLVDRPLASRTGTELPNAPIETAPDPTPPLAARTDFRGKDLSNVRVLGQTRNRYIIAQTDNALVVIDQHIAHERVLYERFVAAARAGTAAGVDTQRLIIPLMLELSKREAIIVDARLRELSQAGFEIEPFGGTTFAVRAVPASVARKTLKGQDGAELTLRAIIDELLEKSVSRRLLLPAEEALITASCKMAVKAGDPLTTPEMEALLADLLRCENPYTCPHGRPIIIELANSEIDRRFGR